LLELSTEIIEHLKSGGTLLVPSRQRASAVRLAYSAMMLAQGRELWDSPDALPWSAWLERELDDARARGESPPPRLTATEEWLLWQEAVHEACGGRGVLMPDGLIDPVRRAVGLLDDYGLTLSDVPTPEVATLRQSMLHFRRRCEDLHVLSRSSWRELMLWLRPSARLLIADSTGIGRERLRWLMQHEARVATPGGETGRCQVFDFETASHEADAAASWCAAQLASDAAARLLVVVPRLEEARHLWERAFFQRLNHSLIVAGHERSTESGFAIEGGRALTSYPLVSTALHLIALASGRAGFTQLSEVLRSVYLSVVPRAARLMFDRWLRERNIASAQLALLRSVLPLLQQAVGENAAAAAKTLLDALEAAGRSRLAMPSDWAQTWAALLGRCGWPGALPLGSDEQQIRMRFDELLGDFAAAQLLGGRLTPEEASSRLQAMALRVSFEPASDDVPVTLTARLEDPIVRYDGIWVAGLSSDVWPPAARPDPLLPLLLQYASAMPTATADGQSGLARQRQERWRDSTRQCVFSWSRTHDDLPHDRSPLLPLEAAGTGTGLHTAQGSRALQDATLEAWYAAQAPVLEAWTERTTPASSVDGVLRGGTRLLELQSLCPFRAYAELRLQAVPLPQPAPGINPQVRGMILHQALELFWKKIVDQTTLRMRHSAGGAELQDLIHGSVAHALRETLAREPGTVSEQMKQREHARTVGLINEMLKWELERPPFVTSILESPRRCQFEGAAIDFRLDRIDVLEGGHELIIDYKTGKPKPFDPLAERLRQPQLPAYAVASGPMTAGVAALYLGREGVTVRGSADAPSRLNGRLAPKDGEPSWHARREQWRQRLQRLVDEYLRGDASVDPLQDACKLCHLHPLCRIDPAVLAALDTDPDNPEGEESEEESEEQSE